MPKSSYPDTALPSEQSRDGSPREAAQYIKTSIEDLATLARAHHMELLGYLLDMARQEAADAAGRAAHGPL